MSVHERMPRKPPSIMLLVTGVTLASLLDPITRLAMSLLARWVAERRFEVALWKLRRLDQETLRRIRASKMGDR